MRTELGIPIDRERLAEFCRRWKIDQLSFFGSVLRDDFEPASDVDVLVAFSPDAKWSLFEIMDAEEELEALFGRKVDLVNRKSIERSPNWIRRKAILESAEPFFAQS